MLTGIKRGQLALGKANKDSERLRQEVVVFFYSRTDKGMSALSGIQVGGKISLVPGYYGSWERLRNH